MKDANSFIQKLTAQVEIIQKLFYSDDTESPIIFSNRSGFREGF